MNEHLIRAKEDLRQPVQIRAYVETVEKAADEEGKLTITVAVASDGTKDRYGETINPDGWDLRAFKKNPVLLWGHDHSRLPVGRVSKIFTADGKLKFAAEFAPTVEGQEIGTLYKDGFLSAFSVGFLPTKFGPDFWLYQIVGEGEKAPDSKFTYDEQELLEISCVTVPANPKALVEARSLVTSEAVKSQLKEAAEETPTTETPTEAAPPAPSEPKTPAAPAEATTEAATPAPAATEPVATEPTPDGSTEPAKSVQPIAEHEWQWTELDGEAGFLKDPDLKRALTKVRSDYLALEARIETLRKQLEEKTGQPVTAKEAVKVLNVRMGELKRKDLVGLDKSVGLRLRVIKTPNPQQGGGDNT